MGKVYEDTRLFVGGSADGRRKSVRHVNRVMVVQVGPADQPLQTEEYDAFDVAGERRVFRLWVLKGLTPDDVLSRVFEGYPAPSPETT